MRTRREIMSEATALLEIAPLAKWEAKDTPYAPDDVGAQIRTTGGRFVASFADPDDARLAVGAVKLLRELAGLA